MSEHEYSSQLSALFDGELPPQQAQMVIRRALKEPAMRGSWERYALIGACMRGDPLLRNACLVERVQARLAAERELNVAVLPVRSGASRRDAVGYSRFGRGALGSAIAAGVAVVAILVVRAVGPDAQSPALVAQGMASDGEAGAEWIETAPGSYTTPGANSPAQRRLDASLSHYLVAHSEEAASALRSSYELLVGVTDLTEDQMSALR